MKQKRKAYQERHNEAPAMGELEKLAHSCSHLLAAAVTSIWPQAKPALGPPIENGFYYDFDFGDVRVTENDLPKIEAKMGEIVKNWSSFARSEKTPPEAKEFYAKNEYKKELIDELAKKGEAITFYRSGDFVDLCAGDHVENPKESLKHFRLLSVAGAYWRGDEKNKMLTRIYGTVFESQEGLGKYLWQRQEAEKRDHRRLGVELELFAFSKQVGPGLPLWLPKGTIIREELEKWAKETEKKWGYQRVATPHLAKRSLYEISGHIPYYQSDMFPSLKAEGEEYFLKGMNCPHHHMIYLAQKRSYRELPLRLAEYGTVYRFEMAGVLYGLMRVRSICQNDAHIYCRKEQAKGEFLQVIKLHEYYYQALGLTKDDYHIVLALPDEGKKEKYHGDKNLWAEAERLMREAVEESGIRLVEEIGSAAFYGPKIDFNIRSSVGRVFGMATNQLDLYMPTRFNLTYTDKDGREKLCVIIHRAPLGSHERFIGFLIEHFGGAFPLWLAPVQAVVLPVSDKHLVYAQKIKEELDAESIRAEVDVRNETLNAKIRDSQIQKVPYMLVVGEREGKNGSVALRRRDGKDEGEITLKDFIQRAREKVLTRSLSL